MQQLHGEEKINTGDDCFHEDNRTFSLSYQVYVYDYIYNGKYIKAPKVWNFDQNIVYCYNHYNHLESYKQQVLVVFDEK